MAGMKQHLYAKHATIPPASSPFCLITGGKLTLAQLKHHNQGERP